MKNFLIAVMLMLTATYGYAQQTSVDVSGLSSEQIRQLAAKADEMKKDPVNVSTVVRQEAEAWGQMGANMGKAVVSAAKEVGVAANEFSQTSLGKIVVVLVAYKLVGHDALGILFGTFTLIIGNVLAVWVFVSNRGYTITYDYKPVLWGAFNRKVITEIARNDEATYLKYFASGCLLFFGWLVGLNCIF